MNFYDNPEALWSLIIQSFNCVIDVISIQYKFPKSDNGYGKFRLIKI